MRAEEGLFYVPQSRGTLLDKITQAYFKRSPNYKNEPRLAESSNQNNVFQGGSEKHLLHQELSSNQSASNMGNALRSMPITHPDSGSSAGQRLYRNALRIQEKRRVEFQATLVKQAEQELEECSFHPRVNHHKLSQQDSLRQRLGTFQLLFEQAQRPKQNIETLRQILEEQELSQVRPVPEINEISRKIVEARREVYSQSNKENLNTSNTLFEESKILQERKLTRQQLDRSRFPFHPTINKNSNCFIKLLGKGFYERVEQDLKKREQMQGRLPTETELYEYEKEVSLCYDEKTGQKLYNPSLQKPRQSSGLNSNRLSQSVDCIRVADSPKLAKKHYLKPSSLLSSKINSSNDKMPSVHNSNNRTAASPQYGKPQGYLNLEEDGNRLVSATAGTRSTRTSQIPNQNSQDSKLNGLLPQIREVYSAQQLKERLRSKPNPKMMSRGGHSHSTDSIGLPSRVTRTNQAVSQGQQSSNIASRQRVNTSTNQPQDNSSLISVDAAYLDQPHEVARPQAIHRESTVDGQNNPEITINEGNLLNNQWMGQNSQDYAETRFEDANQPKRTPFREIHPLEEDQDQDTGMFRPEHGENMLQQASSPFKRPSGQKLSANLHPFSQPILKTDGIKKQGSQSRPHPLRCSNTPSRSRDSRLPCSRDEPNSSYRHDASLTKSGKSSRHSSCSKDVTCVEYQSFSCSSSQKGVPEINSVSKELAEEKFRSAVQQIFQKLDSDSDGIITPSLICLDNLSVRQLKVLSPLLFELEDLNQTLNPEEFYQSVQLLCKSISIKEKRDLLYPEPAQFVDPNLTFKVVL